jgi:LPXTG-motif cell wall-anchored protein
MSLWDVVTAPVKAAVNVATAPVKAVGAIVKGENVISSIASANPIAQAGQFYGQVAQSAGLTASNAASIPVIGSDIANVINYSNDPYDFSNFRNYGLTAVKIGGAAYLGAGGVTDAIAGYGIGSQLQSGNVAGALRGIAGYAGDYGDALNFASGFLPKNIPYQGSAPVSDTVANYATYDATGSDKNNNQMLVAVAFLAVTGYFIYKRFK